MSRRIKQSVIVITQLIIVFVFPSVPVADVFPVTGYIAQNIAEEENVPDLPPLPSPRAMISTEKPIEGGLQIGEEVITDEQPMTQTEAQSSGTEPNAVPQSGTSLPGEQALQSRQQAPAALGTHLMEELSLFNVPTGNLRTVKTVIDEEYNLRGLVWGDELNYLHILEADANDNFREVWKSPSLNGEIRGVFVEDLENDGQTEIIAYTASGNFFIYGYESRTVKYRTPEGTYDNILCMVVADLDGSPEKEIFFNAVRAGTGDPNAQQPVGNLIQFDPVSLFEEWTSQERYAATDMIIGNVDNDEEREIILNTGEILDLRFKGVEWQSDIAFGSRLYLIDLDSDGLLELVTEYNQSYIRVFDIDQRREKW